MGQHQEIVAGSRALRRMSLVLAVAAVMVALMVTSVTPAFAAPNTTFTCFISNVRGSSQVAEDLSKGQANQFEANNPDTFCVPAGQEQLEVLTGQRKAPPGQQRKLAEEPLVEERPVEEVLPVRQLADELI